MELTTQTIAPGARIVVRDAEWLVRRVDRTSTGRQAGRQALSVIGISELVRDKDAVFLGELEQPITILEPEKTKLVPASGTVTSREYYHSRNFLNALNLASVCSPTWQSVLTSKN